MRSPALGEKVGYIPSVLDVDPWLATVAALKAPSAPVVTDWPLARRRVFTSGDQEFSNASGSVLQLMSIPRPSRKRIVLTDDDIVKLFRSGGATGPRSVAEILGMSCSSAHRYLGSLVRRGRLERVAWDLWKAAD